MVNTDLSIIDQIWRDHLNSHMHTNMKVFRNENVLGNEICDVSSFNCSNFIGERYFIDEQSTLTIDDASIAPGTDKVCIYFKHLILLSNI